MQGQERDACKKMIGSSPISTFPSYLVTDLIVNSMLSQSITFTQPPLYWGGPYSGQ